MTRFPRKLNTQSPRKVFRVYTEGKKTEPNYFGAIKDELRLSEIDIKVHGMGDHTVSLVEWVIERKNEEDASLETEWWVVFDKDDHKDFNRAIDLAESKNIHAAYSNECFELWFILHFEFLQTSLGRNNFESKLTKLLGKKYGKNSSDIYELIKDKENDAIRNAEKLEEMHDKQGVVSQEKRDPSTAVHKLVERLRLLKTERERSRKQER